MIEHFSDAECDALIRIAAKVLPEAYGDGPFPVAEVIDCAWDQSEYTVYLEPREELNVAAAITRSAYALLGIDGGASDSTSVTAVQLQAIR